MTAFCSILTLLSVGFYSLFAASDFKLIVYFEKQLTVHSDYYVLCCLYRRQQSARCMLRTHEMFVSFYDAAVTKEILNAANGQIITSVPSAFFLFAYLATDARCMNRL